MNLRVALLLLGLPFAVVADEARSGLAGQAASILHFDPFERPELLSHPPPVREQPTPAALARLRTD